MVLEWIGTGYNEVCKLYCTRYVEGTGILVRGLLLLGSVLFLWLFFFGARLLHICLVFAVVLGI